jgi:ABC-type polysaccharide/polyol phosphate export permease
LNPRSSAAIRDMRDGIGRVELWSRMGWAEVRGKYRRTTLGPFWATFSLGIFIFALGAVWSKLWNVELTNFMPYVATGMVAWTLIAGIVGDGAIAFTNKTMLIKGTRFPLLILGCAVTWNHLIIFGHNLLIVVLAGIIFGITITPATLLLIPGVILIWINGVWVTTLLGLLGARFRDIHVIIATILQVMIFITPVFWTYEQIGGRVGFFLIKLNVLLHYIEILRMPLLGKIPSMYSYSVVLGCTAVGWLLMFAFFSRFYRRVAYWL